MPIALLQDVAAVGAGQPVQGQNIASMSAQGVVAGTGAVSATVVIEGSNNGIDWITIATLNLTGTGRGSDGGAIQMPPWSFVRGRVTAISGTSAAVTVLFVPRGPGYGS